MSKQVGGGIYAGIPYIVVKKNDKLYIGLSAGAVAHFTNLKANLHLLDDIGDQDPDEAMAAMFDSIPKG